MTLTSDMRGMNSVNGQRKRHALLNSVLSAGIMLAMVPAPAVFAQTGTQDATASSGVYLEMIVVTARRRTETLLQTPMAITALTAEAYERSGISDLGGISRLAPNILISPAKQSKSISAFIRGVGQDEDFFTFQPSVGIYLDDVYQGTMFGSAFELLDIDRVEVLRGPQGTLFGKSTQGGAIRVFTKDPQGDDSGYVEVGVGSYKRVDVRAAADISIVPDKLLFRISGGGIHSSGYSDVIDFRCANPGQAGTLPGRGIDGNFSDCTVDELGDRNIVSARAALKLIANEDLSIVLRGDYTNDKGAAAPDKLVAINPAVLAGLNNNTFIPRYGIPVDERFLTGDKTYSTYGSFVDPDSGASMPIKNTAFTRGVSATVEWDVTDDMQIKSITAFRKSTGEAGWDTDNTPMVMNHSYRQYDQEQISQELLLSGESFNDRLEWTFGGYYFKQDHVSPSRILTGPAGVGLAANYLDEGTDKSWSVFGHLVYSLTDELQAEAGYRHSKEDREYTFIRNYFALFGAPTTIPTETEETHNDFRAGLSYFATPDVTLYANVSTGFKAGGFNPRPVFPSQITSFEAETVTAYEGGLKANMFDSRVQANFAGFYSRYKDVQKPAYLPSACGGVPLICSPQFTFGNVGNARVWGLEAELRMMPVEHLTIDAMAGYTNFKYTFIDPLIQPGGATIDSVAPFVPKFQAHVGAQYDFVLGDGSMITPRVDVMYRSRVYYGAANLIEASQSSYALVNARLTWTEADEKWSASLAVTNLTDKFYYTYLGETLNSIGIVNGQPGRPREFRFSVNRKF